MTTTTVRAAYNALSASFSRQYRLQHALSILEADAACTMPPGGAKARGSACAELATIIHAEKTQPSNIEHIDFLQAHQQQPVLQTELSEVERQNLREISRLMARDRFLTADLVKRRTEAQHAAETAWRVARSKSDFQAMIKPYTAVFNLQREAAMLIKQGTGSELSLYEICMSEHDPLGFSLAEAEAFFADLKTWLPAAIKSRVASQQKQKPHPNTPVPVRLQEALCKELAVNYVNFSLDRGVLATSTHPMTAGVPEDVRLTNRFDENDWLNSVLGAMHEGGHAVAEQGRCQEVIDQPVSVIRGMSIHESQSLLHEMAIGRSIHFYKHLSALARKIIVEDGGVQLRPEELDPERMMFNGQYVQPGEIRVDADELTYPLHVAIRFEIEKFLFDSSSELPMEERVAKIPEMWNQSYKKLLGVEVSSDQHGCLQDIHWSFGAVGYFPSYTFGAAISAQLFHNIRKQLGSEQVDEMIVKGDLKPIQNILREHIWNSGSRFSVQEMLKKFPGDDEGFCSKYYKDHLLSRYAPLE